MSVTLDLPTMNILSRAAASCGADFQSVLADKNIAVSADGTPFNQLTSGDVFSLLAALNASACTGHFPFAVAKAFHFDGLPEVSAFLASSQHLRQAQVLFEWIPSLIHPALSLHYEDEGKTAATQIKISDTGNSSEVFIEVVAAIATQLTYELAPHLPQLSEVQFKHSAITEQTEYENFFRCPVSFNGRHNLIRIPSAALDQILPGNLPVAHEHAEASIRQKVIHSGDVSLEQQIQTLLLNNYSLFSGGIHAIAQALKLHPRQLQRQLKEQGKSYSQILANTRHQLACEMLVDSNLDIESIAIKLGFNERRSFTQAFRKSAQLSPSAYRKEQRQ